MPGRVRRLVPTILVLLLALAPNAVAQKSGQPQPMCQSGCLGTTSVSVTPDGGQVTRVASSGNTTAVFTVHNTSSQLTLLFLFSCSAAGGISCVNVSPSSASIPAGDEESVTVTYSVGSSPGTVTLTAYDDTYGATDTGDYTIRFPGPPAAALVNYNGDNQDRSLCLTAGAGYDAAFQCGDLMVAHAMPGYATMGRERAPTLIFNTSQSAPVPFAHVQITLGGTQAVPDSVYVALQVNGGSGYVTRRTGTWNGWGSAGAAVTREVGMAYTSGESSGAYPFRIVMQNIYNGIGSYADTVTGKFLVVNRSASVFGRGWSLAGLEWIHSQTDGMVWVGGDGSIKLYPIVNDTTWIAPPGAFRDTLVYHAGSNVFVRTLRHGVTVTYDAGGRHIQTTNRAGQVTRFWWTTSPERLDSISVPPGGSGTVYRLAYDGNGYLDKITDPAGRVLDATVSGGKLIRLTDPDTLTTYLQYDAGGNITKQLARRRDSTATGWTNYAYVYGIHLTQASISLDSTSTSYATTDYRAWDEKDLGANGGAGNIAAIPDSLYTGIYGPRVGVADDAKFWVDRWGAPVTIIDPLGARTDVHRGDAQHPALVTQLIHADQSVDSITWDSRANLLTQSTITDGLTNSQPALHLRWTYVAGTDLVDSLIGLAGETTRFAYNGDALPSTVTAPNGHITQFSYAPAPLEGVVQAVTESGVPVWSAGTLAEDTTTIRTAFALNALGNVTSDTSDEGHVRLYARDSAQRVTAVTDPGGHQTDYLLDPLNRIVVSTRHIESGVLLTTRFHYRGDVIDSVIDPRGVVRRYEYDNANRRVHEIDDYGVADSSVYDAGGLILAHTSRSGRIVTYRYDAAGRPTAVLWPQGDAYTTADSTLMTYDTMGRLLGQSTSGSQVARTYYATGALKSETQLGMSANMHLNFRYDSAGRRSAMVIGTQGNSALSDSAWYHYDSAGQLAVIGVRWRGTGGSDSVLYAWDPLGRRRQVTYASLPHAATIRYAYDGDGVERLICGAHQQGEVNDPFNFTLHNDSVDADGLILDAQTSVSISFCGGGGNGSLAHAATYDARHQIVSLIEGTYASSFLYDSSGNRIRRTEGTRQYDEVIDPGHNRLVAQNYSNTLTGDQDQHIFTYKLDGARGDDSLSYDPPTGGPVTGLFRAYRYDGLARASGAVAYTCVMWRTSDGHCLQVNQSGNGVVCGYDAVGRLVQSCDSGGPIFGYDGQNIVRTNDDASSYGWTFIHGPGTDDPIMGYHDHAGMKAFYITDGSGRQFGVSTATGADLSADATFQDTFGAHTGASSAGFGFGATRTPSSAIEGISFFRNRWYDQATGRWTQEDPTGVAGGVNLYQFSGNNPVAFTDPFGLKVCFQGSQKAGVCDDSTAKRLWDETYANAPQKQKDMMDALIASDDTWGLRFGQLERHPVLGKPGQTIGHRWGEAGPATKDYSGGTITIDIDDINRHLKIQDARIALSHEVGHWDPNDSGDEEGVIRDYENPARDAWGFSHRGKYADDLPALGNGGGVRFP